MKLKALFVSFAAALFLLAAPIAWAGSVNINTATVEQLQDVKGIGPKTAEAIVAYRDEHGQFSSLDDLVHVAHIGEKTLAQIRDELTTGD